MAHSLVLYISLHSMHPVRIFFDGMRIFLRVKLTRDLLNGVCLAGGRSWWCKTRWGLCKVAVKRDSSLDSSRFSSEANLHEGSRHNGIWTLAWLVMWLVSAEDSKQSLWVMCMNRTTHISHDFNPWRPQPWTVEPKPMNGNDDLFSVYG